ncbi:hypothetical protein Aduo_009632 [Ancylostoma duodenale]
MIYFPSYQDILPIKTRSETRSSRVTSANILLGEIAHVDEFIAAVEKVKVEYEDTPRQDVVDERLLHIQSLLEEIAAAPVPMLAQQWQMKNIKKAIVNRNNECC